VTTERVAGPPPLPRQVGRRPSTAGPPATPKTVIDLRSDLTLRPIGEFPTVPDPPAVIDLRDLPDPPLAVDIRRRVARRPGRGVEQDIRRDTERGGERGPDPGLARPAEESDELLRRFTALPPHSPIRSLLRHQVVESHLPLVRLLAQRFLGHGESLDDLIQVGSIGLLNAVDRFDPERGGFAGFATPTILGEIRRHFRDRSWALRVPRRVQELGRQVSRSREELTHRLGRSPTVQELAADLGTDPDLVVEAIDTATAYATVPLPSASEESRFDALGVPDEGLDLVEDRLTLRPLLARLPTRERTILALRFVNGMSQSQIAAEVGISQMHVSRLLARSLTALREGLAERA
jgi:RNA polymerase sigma-B factor